MRSVTAIILFAFTVEAFQDSEDSFVDKLFDKVLEKLYSRASEAYSLHDADLDRTTLGKAGLAATPSSRISAVPTFRSSALPMSRMSAPSQFGATWQSTPQTIHQLASKSVHHTRTQLAPKAAVVDENCDPAKMVCVAEAGQPHGGNLVNTYVESEDERKKMIDSCDAKIEISERQACDVSLLITGGLSPLDGFMKKADYDSVVKDMRLADGTLMGLPVVLDVTEASYKGKKILLTYKGTNMGVMEVEDEWEPDKKLEAEKCYGTASDEHPTAAELYNDLGKYYIGGKVHGLMQAFDVVWGNENFKSPAEVRKTLPEGKQVVAFQNRNPVHKAHFELLVAAKEDIPNSIIFVHPTCGPTQPGDIDGNTRIKTYEVLQEDPFYKKWAGDAFRWSYLPYSMKMAGPREAIQHMIIRKNFGATHFIIGRDMAGTKSTKTGDDFYGPFDAQLMGEKHADELAMKVAKYPNMVYVGEQGNARGFATEQDAKDKGLEVKKLSGTKFRDALRAGEDVPEWFAFPQVVKTLQEGGDKIFIPG